MGSAGELDEDEVLDKNPQLKRLFNKFLDERLKLAEAEGSSSGAAAIIRNLKTPDKSSKNTDLARNFNRTINQKSPSDTTIYVPALSRPHDPVVDEVGPSPVLLNRIRHPTGNVTMNREASVFDKISNFVETMREEATAKNDGQTGTLEEPIPGTSNGHAMAGFDEASKKAEQAILEAEKFKATISRPPGLLNNTNIELLNPGCGIPCGSGDQPMISNLQNMVNRLSMGNEQQPNVTMTQGLLNDEPVQQSNNRGLCNYLTPVLGAGLSDDDFFHLTCHIDPQLRAKIEKGDFVDLDRLLPKDRFGQFESTAEAGNPLQWVQNESGTFLVPSKRTSKINSFRRWEQAFRVYATIYCGENPNRSREIWQYISVINTAASTFVWDNVYNYDIIFRQLMQFNPARSWAVTYNQMWNLTMKEHINKFQGRNGNSSLMYNNGTGMSSAGNGGSKKSKGDYCWSFNRGQVCRFGRNCRFIERCSYCDSPSHGVYIPVTSLKKEKLH